MTRLHGMTRFLMILMLATGLAGCSTIGGWFGTANANSDGYSALAQQGSGLSSLEMSLVGSASADAVATAAIVARSTADISFIASASESISWIASLGAGSSGGATHGAPPPASQSMPASGVAGREFVGIVAGTR